MPRPSPLAAVPLTPTEAERIADAAIRWRVAVVTRDGARQNREAAGLAQAVDGYLRRRFEEWPAFAREGIE